MQRVSNERRAATALALTLLFGLAALAPGCRGGGKADANAPPPAGQAQAGEAAPADAAQLNAEIENLERQAERNPADDATRDLLARAYVRRGNAQRGAGRLSEALSDYQSALRIDPDNGEAQAGAAAATEQLGGAPQEDENGAPAPLPITPNVADEGQKPTPKRP